MGKDLGKKVHFQLVLFAEVRSTLFGTASMATLTLFAEAALLQSGRTYG